MSLVYKEKSICSQHLFNENQKKNETNGVSTTDFHFVTTSYWPWWSAFESKFIGNGNQAKNIITKKIENKTTMPAMSKIQQSTLNGLYVLIRMKMCVNAFVCIVCLSSNNTITHCDLFLNFIFFMYNILFCFFLFSVFVFQSFNISINYSTKWTYYVINIRKN